MAASCNISFNTYVANLTSSYANRSNEATMVSSSIFILALAGIFFNINLLRRFSDLSAVRNRGVQRLLSSVLSIFIPVMSYLFSEAKNSDPVYAELQRSGLKPDLPRRAGIILIWMLLVELLRNNTEEIRMRGYKTSGIIQRAGRVVWLGSLVFFNVRSDGRKAVLGGLWILCASKLVQRVAFVEAGKRSYVHHKNSRLIASYMSLVATRDRATVHADVVAPEHVVQVDEEHQIMKRCEYIVMGEEGLVKEATAHGYKLYHINPRDTSSIVTVGKIWAKLSHVNFDVDQRLRRLSLSFALFKLLRRRFEYRGEMSLEETSDCTKLLLFKGGQFKINGEDKQAEAVFQVMKDEVNFLRDYYNSVVPVVLASPFFLLSNYLLLPVVLLGLWLMTVLLCGNGDVSYSFKSITEDNYTLNFGIINLTKCLLEQVTTSPQVFFSTVDIFITFLMLIIFLYEEVWEFFLFILSNWFVVSLLCNYVSKPKWRESFIFVGAFRCIVWVRSNKMQQRELSFKQFSALNLCWPLMFATPSMISLTLRSVPVPGEVKHNIVEYILCSVSKKSAGTVSKKSGTVSDDGKSGTVSDDGKSGTVSHDGKSALEKLMDLFPHTDLSWACESESAAEVILTWHIATSLILHVSHRDKEEATGASSSMMVVKSRGDKEAAAVGSSSTSDAMVKVATRLSEYCAYLVVFHPELLPDNKDKTKRVYTTMKEELRSILGFVDYYFSGQDARAKKILACRCTENKVLKNGAKLADMLIKKLASTDEVAVWQLLAHVWTGVMVCVAPSIDEVQVKGHENLLVQGPEFITLLWALTTHTGFYRKPTLHHY